LPDFEDYILEGGWDLLFSGGYECPECGCVIHESDNIEWINKDNKTFKCPSCQANIEIN